MRLGIRAKQIAGVTAVIALTAVTLSVIYVSRLSNIILRESHARAQLLANAILHHAGAVVAGAADPYTALRDDRGLRSILESSIYSENVTGAAILDPAGSIVAHNDPRLIGRTQPARADLGALLDRNLADQLAVIYSEDGRTLEVRKEMLLGDEAFGSIRIGVSTLLMRAEMTAVLRPALLAAAAALAIAVFVAIVLAQLLLRPIHVIRGGLTRLGKGEFGVTLDLPPGDEFGELGTFFNTVSQQLSADRSLLADQKAHLQSAVEHLEDAVALFNPSGELLFSNPAMEPTLPPDAIGRALQGLLPNGHPYRTLVEETLATRKSRGPLQVTMEDSRTIDVRGALQRPPVADPNHERLLMTHAIQGTDGGLVGVLLVSRNLAYLSRMQSTIAFSRKLVALGRLTAGIAHEVKNPLNAMMIHLELLRTKIRNGAMVADAAPLVAAAPGRGARVRTRPVSGPLGLTAPVPAPALPPAIQGALEHVEIIESEIRRLDEVVQGFLKFTRPEDLRLQPVRVATLFDEILPVVAPEAQKNRVRILVECPPTLPAVNGDAAMLRQAFLNLAINACQAMPQGGTLRLVAAAASRDRVEVRVEDTGVGIPADSLGKIFDLYFTTKDHGTGIGLSMVYRIVQLHDGEVEVQSTPGHGTTFRLLLPRAHEL